MAENIFSTHHDTGMNRYVPRQASHSTITIYNPLKSKLVNGKLCTYSSYGFYVESKSRIEPGTIVCITHDEQLADFLSWSPAGYITAAVRWSQELHKEEAGYGMGFKLCMPECDSCKSMIPVDQINTFPGPLNLCPRCADIAQGMPEGKLKSCLTQFFMGNVI